MNSIQQRAGEPPTIIRWRVEGQLDTERLRLNCVSSLKRLLEAESFAQRHPQCASPRESQSCAKTDQLTWEEHNCVGLRAEDCRNWLIAFAETMRLDSLVTGSLPKVHCAMVRTEVEGSEIFIAPHPTALADVNWAKVIDEISCSYNGRPFQTPAHAVKVAPSGLQEGRNDNTNPASLPSADTENWQNSPICSLKLASKLDDQGCLGGLAYHGIAASNQAISHSEAPLQPDSLAKGKGNWGKAGTQSQENEAVLRRLTEIWESLLNIHPVQKSDDFFELGGHSLLAAKLLTRINSEFQKELSPATLLSASTIEKQVRLICSGAAFASMLTTRTEAAERRAAMVFIGGDPTFLPLSRLLSAKFDFHSFGLTRHVFKEVSDPRSLSAIADYFAAQIAEFAGDRPLALAGWCAQGVLALEIARRLQTQGFNVGSVILLQTSNPIELAKYPNWKRAISRNQLKWHLLVFEMAYLKYLGGKRGWHYLVARLLNSIRSLRSIVGDKSEVVDPATGMSLVRDFDDHIEKAAQGFHPLPYHGRVLLIRGRKKTFGFASKPDLGWAGLLPKLRVQEVPGNHFTIYMHPNAQNLVLAIEEYWSLVDQPPAEARESPDEGCAARSAIHD